MAFNAHFFLTRTANKNVFSLTDDSTGSDPGLTGRVISVYKPDGQQLGADIQWPIANSSITLDILNTDAAINVSVFWQSSAPEPSPSTYTYSQIYALTAYGRDFLYNLTQFQTSNPNIINDQNYYANKMKLLVELDSANNAIDVGQDLFGAQSCINRYLFLMQNDTFLF